MSEAKGPETNREEKRGPGGARMQPGGEDWGDVGAQGTPNGTNGETTAPTPPPAEKAETRIDTEDEVAEASDESFPASDPPSFNPGKA